MELIYLYIDRLGNNIRNQGINFSPNFNVKIEDSRLIIDNLREKRGEFQKKIYPENIENITMLLGKNGSGKTTILNLLGMTRDDRCKYSITGNKVRDQYFLLYHIEDNKYALEVLWETNFENQQMSIPNLIRDIKNIVLKSGKNYFYKIPMGVVLKKKDEYFEVVENLFKKDEDGKSLSDAVQLNYIICKYSQVVTKGRIGKSSIQDSDDHLYKRKYIIDSQMWILYKYLARIIESPYLNISSKKAFIDVDIDLDYNTLIYEKDLKINVEKWINNIGERLLIYDEPLVIRIGNEEIRENKFEKFTSKEIFLYDAISRYIINIFELEICRKVKDEDFKSKEGKKLEDINYKKFLDKLEYDEYKQSDSTDLLGEVVNLETEYENLIRAIEYYEKKEVSNYNRLMYISRYLYSRTHKEIEKYIVSEYQSSMEEMFEKIRNLDERYFYKNSLRIECSNIIDKNVESFFKTYNKYKLYEYVNNYKGSDVGIIFKFNISNLSEGEENFVNLLSKIFDIIENSEDGKLNIILLDEPDKSLHPEWSRQFIKFICDGVKEFKNKKIQFILSTHSPFMVSDILSENIYYLENKVNQERNEITISKMGEKGGLHNSFGANIYDILKDSFILEKTIGEYAYEKISEFIKVLQREDTVLDDEYVSFFINSIGEEVLRKKLKDMYRIKRKDKKAELINRINLLNDEDKLNKIKEILNGDKYD